MTVTRRRLPLWCYDLTKAAKVPSEMEARTALAMDLARGQRGPNEAKARRIAYLPLMDVALDGLPGMALAQAKARFAAREAA